MKKYTAKELIAEGYKLDNALITNVSLSSGDYCCLTLDITLKGDAWAAYTAVIVLAISTLTVTTRTLMKDLRLAWKSLCVSWIS